MSLVNLVCAFHRPADFSNVVANTRRQTMRVRLIVVANGPALGSPEAEELGRMGAIVLESEPHQAIARTTAFDWLRARGGGVWATWDSDDYYGPGYAEEVWEMRVRSRGAALWGKSSIYIRPEPERLWLWSDWDEGWTCDFLHGATLSGWAETTLDQRDVGPHGEDWDQLARTIAAGGRCWGSGPAGYAWSQIGSDHAGPPRFVRQVRDRSQRPVREWIGPDWAQVVDGVETRPGGLLGRGRRG